MPVVSPDLGYGATFAMGTSTFTAAIRSITVGDETRETVNASHLTTATVHRLLVGDLYSPPAVDIEYIWSSTTGKRPPFAPEETITVTLPDTSTLIGKGAFTARGGPNLEIEGLMVGTGTMQFTGLDSAGTGAGPVLTAAT